MHLHFLPVMMISMVVKYFVLIELITISVSKQTCLENCAHGTEPSICESETCLTGCRTGWYGPHCSKRCSPKCQKSACEQTNGSCMFDCKYSLRVKSRKCTSVFWKKNKRSSNDICVRKNSTTNKCECCKTNFRGDSCEFGCDKCLTYLNVEKNICRYMCKPGYYGFTCNNTCPHKCALGNSGDPLCEETRQHGNGRTTIKCSNGCQQGYFGDLCSKICSERCKNNTCYQVGGTCVDCPDTFYGNNCDLPCSSRCLQGICHRNGTCVFQCQNGYYGLECDKRCFRKCHACNQTSGVCLTCERGWYGEYCNRTCGIKCRDGTCFRNGTCKGGCDDGFLLSDSNDCVVGVLKAPVEDSSASSAAVAVPLVIVGLLVVAAAVVVYKFKKEWILSRCRRSNQKTRNRGLPTTAGDIKKVQQMPELENEQQPTIAILTTSEAGKEAVDAMMDNYDSYQIGNKDDPAIYTIGDIGSQKVVSTKFVLSKHNKDVTVLQEGFTTRFLGIFRNVHHVFLVSVGGGIRKTDNTCSQILRGDVVISLGRQDQEAIYYPFEDTCQGEYGNFTKFVPRNRVRQDIAKLMEERISVNSGYAPWTDYMQQGREKLQGQRGKYSRPCEDDDSIVNKTLEDTEEIEQILSDDPKLHFGPIASCSEALDNDSVKIDCVIKYGISAFESRYEHVLDYICGNAKDSFMLVLGVTDFNNGSQGKEWEPYASLAAAAVVKTIIITLDS